MWWLWILLLILIILFGWIIGRGKTSIKIGGKENRIAIIGHSMLDYKKLKPRLFKPNTDLSIIHQYNPNWIITTGEYWPIANAYEREYPQKLKGIIHHKPVGPGNVLELPHVFVIEPALGLENLGKETTVKEVISYL